MLDIMTIYFFSLIINLFECICVEIIRSLHRDIQKKVVYANIFT